MPLGHNAFIQNNTRSQTGGCRNQASQLVPQSTAETFQSVKGKKFHFGPRFCLMLARRCRVHAVVKLCPPHPRCNVDQELSNNVLRAMCYVCERCMSCWMLRRVHGQTDTLINRLQPYSSRTKGISWRHWHAWAFSSPFALDLRSICHMHN